MKSEGGVKSWSWEGLRGEEDLSREKEWWGADGWKGDVWGLWWKDVRRVGGRGNR